MRRNNISSIHNVLCILNVHPPPLSPPHRINITISTRWTARTGIREIIIVVVARPAGFVTVSITTGTGSLRRDRAGVVSSGRTGTSVVRKGESNARWHCHRRITWLPISRSPGQSKTAYGCVIRQRSVTADEKKENVRYHLGGENRERFLADFVRLLYVIF